MVSGLKINFSSSISSNVYAFKSGENHRFVIVYNSIIKFSLHIELF